jgi:hypothetical protein
MNGLYAGNFQKQTFVECGRPDKRRVSYESRRPWNHPITSIHFQYTLLLGNFLFLYCNESVLFFLIFNIQSGRFEFVKKFDTVRL